MDRNTRILHHGKQHRTVIKEIENVDMSELVEGEEYIFYIKGYGLRSVIRHNNEIYYGTYSTTLS